MRKNSFFETLKNIDERETMINDFIKKEEKNEKRQ